MQERERRVSLPRAELILPREPEFRALLPAASWPGAVQPALPPSRGTLGQPDVPAPLREVLLRAQVESREPAQSWPGVQGWSLLPAWGQLWPAVQVQPSA